jgi:hypothetical protein
VNHHFIWFLNIKNTFKAEVMNKIDLIVIRQNVMNDIRDNKFWILSPMTPSGNQSLLASKSKRYSLSLVSNKFKIFEFLFSNFLAKIF